MFRAAERIQQALGTQPAPSRASFRIGVSGVVGRTTNTEFFLPMFALADRVLSIRNGEAADLLRDLRDDELDLAIIESAPPPAARLGLEVVVVDRPVLVAVTAPHASVAADWTNLGIILLRSSAELRWDVQSYLDAQQLRPRIVAETDDVVFLIEAATREGYVAFMPHSIARHSIEAGRLAVIATIHGAPASVFAVYRDGPGAHSAEAVVQRLVDHLAAQEATIP